MNHQINITLLLTLLVATHITTTLSSEHESLVHHSPSSTLAKYDEKHATKHSPSGHTKESTSSRFLHSHKHKINNKQDHEKTKHLGDNYYRYVGARMTCDKYPRVCHVRGSPGPDCCKKKCVDVRSDRLNCGMCGNKCKYSEVCCKGRCVNPLQDRKNCGRCGNKCRRGSFCEYGMCSYA